MELLRKGLSGMDAARAAMGQNNLIVPTLCVGMQPSTLCVDHYQALHLN